MCYSGVTVVTLTVTSTSSYVACNCKCSISNQSMPAVAAGDRYISGKFIHVAELTRACMQHMH
jgi:hypothetical protein